MKLELKHLAPYLPYGLKMNRNVFIGELITLKNDKDSIAETFEFQVTCSIWWENTNDCNHYKPILRPLSDLTKEITHNGETFVPIEEYHYLRFEEISNYKSGGIWLNHIHFREYNVLIELHFDVFGLIEKGLAIDINTLNK